jgi:hypothetical protein
MRVVRNGRAVDPDLVVRAATTDDATALAELFRRVPVADPDGLSWIDHGEGDRWWHAVADVAGRRLFVAEREGAPVGLHAVTVHAARVEDRVVQLALVGPTRVDPLAQGSGAFHALHAAVSAAVAEAGAEPYALVPVRGLPQRLPAHLRRWPVRYERLVIDCRASAARRAATVSRPSPGDAGTLLADACSAAALGPADPGADLARRLAADARRYGPDRLLGNGDAILGVSRLAVTTRSEHTPARRQACAIDVAARSAAALDALVHEWCRRLADDGIDDLVVWACARSSLHDALAPLAARTTAHALDLGLTPPPATAARGIHVDASLL